MKSEDFGTIFQGEVKFFERKVGGFLMVFCYNLRVECDGEVGIWISGVFVEIWGDKKFGSFLGNFFDGV